MAKAINVVQIESRRSKRRRSEFEILVDVQCDSTRMSELIGALEKKVAAVKQVEFHMAIELPMMSPDKNESFGCMKVL